MKIEISKDKPKSCELSVVIPTFDCLEFLPKAISSILEQGVTDYEIIIVDDGSTDGSLEWLEKFKHYSNKISVIRQKNQGVVKARNRAMGIAKGKFIAFLDADDFRYPYTLERQLKYMQINPGCVLSFTNYDHLKEDYTQVIDCFSYWKEFKQITEFNNPLMFYPLKDPLNQLLSTNIVGTSTTMVKTSAILSLGGFSEKMKSASDWEMWLRLAKVGDVAFSSEATTGYLMRAGSITSRRLERLAAISQIIEANAKEPHVKRSAVSRARAHLYEGYADYHRTNENKIRAIYYDLSSLSYSPQFRRLKHLCHDTKRILTPSKINRS